MNPTTGDLTGQRINTLANAVYIRLMTPLVSWWADPTLGSRLQELRREKDRPRVGILAKQYAEQALQTVLDDGRAKKITITAEQILRRAGSAKYTAKCCQIRRALTLF